MPIVTANVTLLLAVAASVYPVFDTGLQHLGEWLVENDVLGAGAYGFANRLLIPFGLHHLLNYVPWFEVGSYRVDGTVYSGDRPVPARRPDRGRVHDRVLPDHDVRAARRGPRDLPRATGRSSSAA